MIFTTFVLLPLYKLYWGFPGGLVVTDLLANAGDQEMWVRSLGWEDLLEEEMVTQSSIPAWKILYIEESVWWGHRESEMTEYTPTGFIGH